MSLVILVNTRDGRLVSGDCAAAGLDRIVTVQSLWKMYFFIFVGEEYWNKKHKPKNFCFILSR